MATIDELYAQPKPSLTVLNHNPDDGCVSCPFAYREQDSHYSITVYCNADYWERYQSKAPATVVQRRQVSRHSAPDWCPIRKGPVTVEAPDA